MPIIDHLDLVVSSIDRSLPFYRGRLGPLGWVAHTEEEGEQAETIHYPWGPDWQGVLGLRQRPFDADESYYRYTLGLHHLAFEAPSRRAGQLRRLKN